MHMPESQTGTVLLIDRNERLPKQREIFEAAGFTVLLANTVEDGLRLVQEKRPDAVISEVMLERPDAGFVLGYRMKKDEQTAHIPLILVSSVFQTTGTILDINSPEARRWIKADAYLERPVAAEHLVAKVSSLIQHPPTIN